MPTDRKWSSERKRRTGASRTLNGPSSAINGINQQSANPVGAGLINDRLDDKCLAHVFSYLRLVEKVRVERVCKRWSRLVRQLLDKQTVLCFDRIPTTKNLPSKVVFATRCDGHHRFFGPDVVDKSLADFRRVDDKRLAAVLSQTPNLESIYLSINTFDRPEHYDLLFDRCPRLECLNLTFDWSFYPHYSGLVADYGSNFVEMIKKFGARIKHLAFEWSKDNLVFDDLFKELVFTSMAYCGQIERLSLDGGKRSDAGSTRGFEFVNSIRKPPTIKELLLTNCLKLDGRKLFEELVSSGLAKQIRRLKIDLFNYQAKSRSQFTDQANLLCQRFNNRSSEFAKLKDLDLNFDFWSGQSEADKPSKDKSGKDKPGKDNPVVNGKEPEPEDDEEEPKKLLLLPVTFDRLTKLRRLSIGGDQFLLTINMSDLNNKMPLVNLRRLSLSNVLIDTNSIEKLNLFCPNLEHLSIDKVKHPDACERTDGQPHAECCFVFFANLWSELVKLKVIKSIDWHSKFVDADFVICQAFCKFFQVADLPVNFRRVRFFFEVHDRQLKIDDEDKLKMLIGHAKDNPGVWFLFEYPWNTESIKQADLPWNCKATIDRPDQRIFKELEARKDKLKTINRYR